MAGRILGWGAFLCALVFSGGAGAAEPLRLLTEDAPPYSFLEQGAVTGSTAELLRATAARAGIPVELELLPWERAYRTALEEPRACVFSTTIPDAREPLFKWVRPLYPNDWILYARADSPIALAKVEDARPFLIGVYRGDARQTWLESLGGFRLAVSPEPQATARQLAAGFIDLWLSGPGETGVALRQGLPAPKPVLSVRTVETGLACNKGVSDATIEALNRALGELGSDGTREQILARFAKQG